MPEEPTPCKASPEYDPLADLYDVEYDHDYDAPLWLRLAARENGPLVEWGAGTGRIAIPLARAGHDVTAVEVSPGMVEKGREKDEASDVAWVTGDMRTARLGNRFGLAVCAFNSFLCLLSLDDALSFLCNAREHLLPGGLLGIEVSAFSPQELADVSPALQHDLTRETDDGWLDRFSVSRYDPASRRMEMRLLYELYAGDGDLLARRARDLTIRVTCRDELALMLRQAGFEVEGTYGGFEGEPFTAASDHLIMLARR